MDMPFIGAEAIRDGVLTRGKLRWGHEPVHPGVYLRRGAVQSVAVKAIAAWLWTDRRGVITGRAAAALHGADWVPTTTPIEMIVEHTRRRNGVIVREERIADDEVVHIGDLPVTSIARTAFDLARHLDRG